MYEGMKIYRGVVSYSAETSVYVQIPSLLGNSVSLPISNILSIPSVSTGDQVIVAVEDSKASNVYIINNAIIGLNGGSA